MPRRRIDKLLIGFGVIAALVFAVAGGLLGWSTIGRIAGIAAIVAFAGAAVMAALVAAGLVHLRHTNA